MLQLVTQVLAIVSRCNRPLLSAKMTVAIWWGVLEMAETIAVWAQDPSVEFTSCTWAISGRVERLKKMMNSDELVK